VIAGVVTRRGELAAQVRALREVLPTVPADFLEEPSGTPLLERIRTKLANLLHAAEQEGWEL